MRPTYCGTVELFLARICLLWRVAGPLASFNFACPLDIVRFGVFEKRGRPAKWQSFVESSHSQEVNNGVYGAPLYIFLPADDAIDFITQEGCGTPIAKVRLPDTSTIPPHDQTGPGEVRLTSIWLFFEFALGTLSNYISFITEILALRPPSTTMASDRPPLPVATLTHPHAGVC